MNLYRLLFYNGAIFGCLWRAESFVFCLYFGVGNGEGLAAFCLFSLHVIMIRDKGSVQVSNDGLRQVFKGG